MSAVRASVGIYTADPMDRPGTGYDWIISSRPFSDISCLVDSVAIRWGREDFTDDGFTPATCTVNLEAGDLPGFFPPPTLVIGSWVLVWVLDPVGGAKRARFAGRITDISWQWSARGDETPLLAGVRVQAASRAAELARTTLDALPSYAPTVLPEGIALDQAITALSQKTGVYYPALTVTGPADDAPGQGTLALWPNKAAGWNVASFYLELADHMDGRVWERCGTQSVIYSTSSGQGQTLGAPGVAASAFTLDACDLLADVAWTMTAEIINLVRFTAPYTTVPIVNPITIGNYVGDGRFGYWFAADAIFWPAGPAPGSQNAAYRMGLARTSRRAFPQWLASALAIDTAHITAAKYSALLRAEPMSTFRINNLPAWAGTPGPTDYMRVEGWAETFSADVEGNPVHDFAVHVRAGIGTYLEPPLPPSAGYQWDDVYASVLWDSVAPAITWNDLEQNTLNPDGSLHPANT